MRAILWLALIALLADCGPAPKPPATVRFAGLPVSGFDDAQRAGFTICVQADWCSLRCRRHGVMVLGTGPY